jgi:bromodomain-containing protein 7
MGDSGHQSPPTTTTTPRLTLVLPPLQSGKLKFKKKGKDGKPSAPPRPPKLKPLKEVLARLIAQIKKCVATFQYY